MGNMRGAAYCACAPSPLVGEGGKGGWPQTHAQAAPPFLSLPLKGGGMLEHDQVKSNHALRHARACPGHPRLNASARTKTWMAGTSPAMTNRRFSLKR